MQTLSEIKDDLQQILSKKRYSHTLGVMYTAAALAMCYEEDVQKAMIAGLLHDCAKQMTVEEMREICQKHQVSVSDIERQNSGLLHAKAGMILAKTKYMVLDSTVLNAIKYHTTGRPNMSLLEKIIYISDYIEPERDGISSLKSIRKLAFTDLDKCIVMISKNTIQYLKANNQIIDSATIETYQYYKTSMGDKRYGTIKKNGSDCVQSISR